MQTRTKLNEVSNPKFVSDTSKLLFVLLIEDAGNWGGIPLWGGNVGDSSRQEAGYLTNLKKAGLLTTEQDSDNYRCQWVHLTLAGAVYAKQLGLDYFLDIMPLNGYENALVGATEFLNNSASNKEQV